MRATLAYPSTARHRLGGPVKDKCQLCERAWPCPPVRRATKTHRVADIRFEHGADQDAAPVTCTCGASMTVAEWADHQRAVKAAA